MDYFGGTQGEGKKRGGKKGKRDAKQWKENSQLRAESGGTERRGERRGNGNNQCRGSAEWAE